MKKRMTALLAGLMAVAMLCTSAFAAEADPRAVYTTFTSQEKTDTQQGVTYTFFTDAHYTTQGSIVGNSTVWVDASADLPRNVMAVQAFMLRSDMTLLTASNFRTDAFGSNYTWAQTDNVALSSTQPTYFGGYIALNIPGYNTPITPKVNAVKYDNGRCTSVAPVAPSDYTLPISRLGLTYGSIMDQDYRGTPDLYAAVGTDGTEGYVASWDLHPSLNSSAKAKARYNQQLEENGNRIPLYDLEMNQIGWFALSEPTEISPDVQAKIDELSAKEVPMVENPEAYALMEEDDGPVELNPLKRWIGCVGDNGIDGYMRYLDFMRHQSDTVDVYDADGNVVDQFTFRTLNSFD